MKTVLNITFFIGLIMIVVMIALATAPVRKEERIMCNDEFSTGWKDSAFLRDGTIRFRNRGEDIQYYLVTEGSLCLHQTRDKEES